MIDYRSLPEVQNKLERLREMRASEDAELRCFGRTLWEVEGSDCWLHVRVTDPAVAQLVLLATLQVAQAIPLPGFELLEVRSQIAEPREAVEQWLRNRLAELACQP